MKETRRFSLRHDPREAYDRVDRINSKFSLYFDWFEINFSF